MPIGRGYRGASQPSGKKQVEKKLGKAQSKGGHMKKSVVKKKR